MAATNIAGTMTYDEAQAFARRWAEEWNRKDVEAVLAHFAENVAFTSARAAATVGTATVYGKTALRSYWLAALQRIEQIQFTVDHAIWDPVGAELEIVYAAAINGQRTRSAELLHFDASGLADRGEAFSGAVLG